MSLEKAYDRESRTELWYYVRKSEVCLGNADIYEVSGRSDRLVEGGGGITSGICFEPLLVCCGDE